MNNPVEDPIHKADQIFSSYAQKLLDRSLIDFTTGLPASVPEPLNRRLDIPILASTTSQAMEEFSKRLVEKLLDPNLTPTASFGSNQAVDEPTTRVVDSVAIIGGGVAGLYAAMLLSGSYGFNVDVIEASDRIGGRLFTHRFNNNDGAQSDEWDYFVSLVP